MDKGKQMRYSEGEMEILQKTFKGNEKLLKLLRKVFLPEYEPDAPIGQVVDLWMTLDLGGLSPQEQSVRIFARNSLITHIEHMINELNALANKKEETPAEVAARIGKDSIK